MRRTTRGLLVSLASTLVLAVGGSAALAAAAPGAYQRPGKTERVSVASDGTQARYAPWPLTCTSPNPVADSDISADGRYVVFAANATNLVPDAAGKSPVPTCKIFWRDRVARKTKLVSIGMAGTAASGQSGRPSISADGRYVAFASEAVNLVPGDTNNDWDVFVRDMRTGRMVRVSLPTGTGQANGASSNPSISAHGRHVAFASTATNLVAGDTNQARDVFVRDVKTGVTRRASLSSRGAQGAGESFSPSISANGRYVAFTSWANLAPVTGTEPATVDVYRRDVKAGKTLRVSVASDGSAASFAGFPSCTVGPPELITLPVTPPSPVDRLLRFARLNFCGSINAGYGGRSISADGRYVVFASNATNLVPNDTNYAPPFGSRDVFVHDATTRRTERVSVDSYAHERDSSFNSHWAVISGNGHVVSYVSEHAVTDCDAALIPVPIDIPGGAVCTQAARDVFDYDLPSGAVDQATVSTSGGQPKAGTCDVGDALTAYANAFSGALNYDGRFVSFYSSAPNLVAQDTNRSCDYFVRDRGPARGVGGFGGAGTGSDPGADPVCVADGVCLPPLNVSASRDAVGEVSTPGADLIAARVVPRPALRDLFVRLDLAHVPAVTGAPTGGLLYGLRFTADGVRYQVRAQRVPGADFDPKGGASFGLFRELVPGVWTKVASLKGGYGTVGDAVVTAVPLSAIGGSTQLTDVTAYTATGSYLTGATKILDSLKVTR